MHKVIITCYTNSPWPNFLQVNGVVPFATVMRTFDKIGFFFLGGRCCCFAFYSIVNFVLLIYRQATVSVWSIFLYRVGCVVNNFIPASFSVINSLHSLPPIQHIWFPVYPPARLLPIPSSAPHDFSHQRFPAIAPPVYSPFCGLVFLSGVFVFA